jgi:hypothetical protein
MQTALEVSSATQAKLSLTHRCLLPSLLPLTSIPYHVARYRRVDYETGAVYHLPDGPSASEAVRPLMADGKVNQNILARLSVRHDDSQENVARRLRLWDRQVCAYCTLSCPLSGRQDSVTDTVSCGH